MNRFKKLYKKRSNKKKLITPIKLKIISPFPNKKH